MPPCRLSRLRLLVASTLAVLILTGCVVRVVYNQLDWLALWYIEDYFDLDAAQEEQARAMISRTLAWHRSTQLPRYASLVRDIRAGLDGAVDSGFVADRYEQIVVLWDELLRRIAPDLARLLQSLSEEQVAELFANLEEGNRDLAREYSGEGPEKRRAKQDKAVIRSFRRFAGRLSTEQEQLVRARTAQFHDLSVEWLDRRAAWQAAFRQLMARRRTDPLFADRIAKLLIEPNQFDTPAYRAQVRENQQGSFELVAAVLGSLSPGQADKLRENLTVYASDFDALIANRTPENQPKRLAPEN